MIKTFSASQLKGMVSGNFPEITNNDNRLNLVSDREYAALDMNWVEDEAYNGYLKWLSIFSFGRNIKNSRWKNNWDCEDISEGFKLYLKLMHAEHNPNTLTERSKGKENESDAQSVAAGVIYFKNSAHSAHAINLLFDKEEQPHFFEPMYGEFIKINEEQRNSIWYANF